MSNEIEIVTIASLGSVAAQGNNSVYQKILDAGEGNAVVMEFEGDHRSRRNVVQVNIRAHALKFGDLRRVRSKKVGTHKYAFWLEERS